jgi:hypothetical protein
MRIPTLILLCFCLTGCGGYELKNLAKSDVDLVSDEFVMESRRLIRELTVKLYKRNPQELRKSPGMTIEGRLSQLTSSREELSFKELAYRQEVAALELVFNPNFNGDRVFALIVGLGGMLRHAYGYNPEFFMFDTLDGDKLLASAHNVDVLVWRLKNSRQATGAPFLISSEYQGVVDNLSFERLFGKLIVLQEMMARIAGDSTDRQVNSVVHAASRVFIPLPI